MLDTFRIQELENVFVTNNMVVTKQGKVLRDSCVGEEFYQKYLTFKFKLKYFFPIFVFSKKRHVLISDEWSKNYCHWLWEALSKLIVMQEKYPDFILLLPSSYKKITFVMTTLAAFGITKKNIRFIPKKSKLKIKNLSFITCIGIGTPGYYKFLQFQKIRDKLVAFYENKLTTNFGERIYISRSKPGTDIMRKVTNEAELTAMLEKFSFKTVYMENFSFLEQLAIANNARYIIAPHGAGITNAMFTPDNSTLIELISEKWLGTCFERMSENIVINYQRIDCHQTSSDKTAWFSDITVDVAKLEKKLSELL